jgi:hypothetical protein
LGFGQILDQVSRRHPKTGQAGFFVYLNTGNGFDSGKQWQSNLGGPGNWKNRPTHENGEYSMLIDINGSLLGFLSNTRSGSPSPLISISMERSPFAWVGRFFQF